LPFSPRYQGPHKESSFDPFDWDSEVPHETETQRPRPKNSKSEYGVWRAGGGVAKRGREGLPGEGL